MWKTWQERRSSGKRGKSDVNVARATLTWQLQHTSSQTWQERRSSGKRGKSDVNVAIATYIFTNVARETFQWKTWQERRSSGKRGKRLMWR
jgi:hypothetical protein